MLRSFLIGLVAGQRGMTPLAAVATATRNGALPPALPAQALLKNPLLAAGTAALAAAEMAGDEMKSAPDRIVPIGLATRAMTAGYAGAAVAPRDRRLLGAAIAVGTALASSYIGWRLRCAAMARFGQTATGFVEDAIVFAGGVAVTRLPPSTTAASKRATYGDECQRRDERTFASNLLGVKEPLCRQRFSTTSRLSTRQTAHQKSGRRSGLV